MNQEQIKDLYATIGKILVQQEVHQKLILELMHDREETPAEVLGRVKLATRQAVESVVLNVGDKSPDLADAIGKIDWTLEQP